MFFKILELLQIILLIQSCTSTSSFIETETDSDYIECYWCNSRDTYCGKRVTDTMVTTIKCPKHSKCTVYTNPYDNYYLHRGCTYGMDLGKVVIENGCFVEEDGSTYCFCDFNRCNAAGILDLRNLIDEKQPNSIFGLANTTHNNGLNDLILNHFNNLQVDEAKTRQGFVTSKSRNFLKPYTTESAHFLVTSTRAALTTTTKKTTKSPITFTTTRKPLKTSTISFQNQHSTSLFPFKTSYDPKKGNLNELLQDYLKFSKHFKENHNSSISFDKYQTINKLNQKNQSNLVKKPKANPKSSMFIDYPGSNSPSQYKLKINDSISKKLIENFRLHSNLNLKPNEKINIVLLKRPIKPEFFQNKEVLPGDKTQNFDQIIMNSNKMSKSLIKRPPEFEQNRPNVEFSSSTKSWLNKLRAKLLPNINEQKFDAYGVTEPMLESKYSWNPSNTQKIKPGNNNSFKCPRDGLFSHPTTCSQFLQCVYYGTIHERYEVFDCPAGLYFNQNLELCDYPQNVQCN